MVADMGEKVKVTYYEAPEAFHDYLAGTVVLSRRGQRLCRRSENGCEILLRTYDKLDIHTTTT